MARTEIIEKRQARSKTFDNGDGTFTAEIGGEHFHHQVDGQWVNTDYYLYGGNIEITDDVSGEKYTHETRSHPQKIRINKFKQPMRIEDIVFYPIECNQVVGVKYMNTITYNQLWNGINLKRIITPVGIAEEITITSSVGQREISWEFETDISNVLAAPYWELEGQNGPVEYNIVNNILTFNLTEVPIGAVIK